MYVTDSDPLQLQQHNAQRPSRSGRRLPTEFTALPSADPTMNFETT